MLARTDYPKAFMALTEALSERLDQASRAGLHPRDMKRLDAVAQHANDCIEHAMKRVDAFLELWEKLMPPPGPRRSLPSNVLRFPKRH